jgi:phosphohistidine phosphatase
MRTLHVLRHAKSSWAGEQFEDHDRPLSKRGRRAAAVMARHLAEQAAPPDLVLCSTATRARETLAPVLERLKPRRVLLDRELYLAGGEALLRRVCDLDDAVGSVLLVGHNPGLHEFALLLAAPDSPVALPPLSGKFPTGALATFHCPSSWRRLKPQTATVVAYVSPRDLMGEAE